MEIIDSIEQRNYERTLHVLQTELERVTYKLQDLDKKINDLGDRIQATKKEFNIQ